jgi:hypothetical protein
MHRKTSSSRETIDGNGDIEMKRLLSILLAFTLMCAVLSGCSTAASERAEMPAFNSSDTTAADDNDDDGEEVDVVPARTISEDGEYTLSGDINGQVLVTAENVTLILDGANITCAEASAILGKDGNGDDIIQNLTVELRGENTVTSGTKHGIQGKDNLTIRGDGVVNISAVRDGLHAGGILAVENGTINVLKSYEGMEATGIVISGGTSTVNATDDGINAAVDEDDTVTPSILMTGGTLVVYCTGDGIDSNGTLDISGGTVALFIGATRDGSTTDVDRSGSILPALFGTAQISAGTPIEVGNWSFTPTSDVTTFCLMLPELTEGESYDVSTNGNALATITATTTIQGMMMGGGSMQGDGPTQGGMAGGGRH